MTKKQSVTEKIINFKLSFYFLNSEVSIESKIHIKSIRTF